MPDRDLGTSRNFRRRWKVWTGAVGLAGLCVAAYFLRPDTGPSRHLDLVGDAARGAYLIRLGGCVSCHTDREHNGAMLAGGKPLATQFGTFYPPNITPDKATGIGTWTLAEFSDALSNGDGPHGNLYPVFPYNDFTLMSDREIVDLFAGIMAVPPVKHKEPDNRIAFPFNIRPLVSGWKNLFFSPHRYQDNPDHSATWNRGAYLGNGPGHCVACHSPRNLLAAIEKGKDFTGNPVGGTGGKAPPITPLALRADGYTTSVLVNALKTGVTPSSGRVGAEMGEVVADETSRWTEEDLIAVSAYLLDQEGE